MAVNISIMVKTIHWTAYTNNNMVNCSFCGWNKLANVLKNKSAISNANCKDNNTR